MEPLPYETVPDLRHLSVFLCGGASGLLEGISIQPLEMLKTRFQINTGSHLKVIPTIREIIREGGVRQLYRGGLPEIAGLVPRATAALSTLEFSRRYFMEHNGGQLSTVGAYVSGGLSGVTEGIVFSPFQVIKVRLMAKEHIGRYRDTWDCLRKVLASEGLPALTIGLAPTLYRNVIWNSLYYGTVFEMERYLPHLDSSAAVVAREAAIGISVGVVATCFNTPFDVVKSRVQSQLPGEHQYTSTYGALATIYRQEGVRALYKGFVPKALRLGLGQTIGLLAFRRLLRLSGADYGVDTG